MFTNFFKAATIYKHGTFCRRTMHRTDGRYASLCHRTKLFKRRLETQVPRWSVRFVLFAVLAVFDNHCLLPCSAAAPATSFGPAFFVLP